MDLHLPDGTHVVVRPIRPDDKQALVEGLHRLSDESVHRRFLAPKPSLSPSELRYLTEVDGVNHFAVVAALAGRPEHGIGVARFVRLPEDPLTADFAVVVEDAFQGRGLGRRLALVLADAAVERGIRRFSATMLSENRAAHRLMQTITARLSAGAPRHGAHQLVGDLAAA